jgi:hypothetical protein
MRLSLYRVDFPSLRSSLLQGVVTSEQQRSTRMSATEQDIQMIDMASRESEPLLYTEGR